jgi:hypothetical protein
LDLLNGSKVDISSLPLDSIGDSEDIEEGDDENELGEIQEEACEESQSSRKKREANYTKIKDTCLVQAWSKVSAMR